MAGSWTTALAGGGVGWIVVGVVALCVGIVLGFGLRAWQRRPSREDSVALAEAVLLATQLVGQRIARIRDPIVQQQEWSIETAAPHPGENEAVFRARQAYRPWFDRIDAGREEFARLQVLRHRAEGLGRRYVEAIDAVARIEGELLEACRTAQHSQSHYNRLVQRDGQLSPQDTADVVRISAFTDFHDAILKTPAEDDDYGAQVKRRIEALQQLFAKVVR